MIKVVDEAVTLHGIDGAVMLFNIALKKTTPKVCPASMVKLMSEFLIGQSIEVFEIKPDDFFENTMDEYKDARMCCFHLLKKYAHCSYPMLGRLFRRDKRSVMHYTTETKERLQIAEFEKQFASRYRELESQLLAFMAALED